VRKIKEEEGGREREIREWAARETRIPKMWKLQWRWQRKTQKPKPKRDKILAREGVVWSRERKKETLKLSKENLRSLGVWIEREWEGQVHRLSETMRGENGVQKLNFFFLKKKKNPKPFYAG